MTDGLIHDWNEAGDAPRRPARRVELNDETLRDGLQSPSVVTPTVDQRLEILHLIDAMGLDNADIGFPGAGPTAMEETLAIVRGLQEEGLGIGVSCAGRTLEADVRPIAEIAQKTGRRLEADLFIGSSPLRRVAEDWTLDDVLARTRAAVAFAVREGLDVMFVTEDSTRAQPADLERLLLTAVECGAKRVCLCDTCGHATPHGVTELVSFARNLLGDGVKIDFHGHMDRGLGVWNSVAAVQAGADRVHGTALGIGERVGNTPMDQLLVNFRLLGWIDNDLTRLAEYCRKVSEATGVAIPPGYPVVGRDAFETATGVHASAVAKALRKGDRWLADRVYSGVPATDFGLEQTISIGPMSGRWNVAHWLEKRGRTVTDDLVAAVLDRAKRSKKTLTDDEVEEAIRSAKA